MSPTGSSRPARRTSSRKPSTNRNARVSFVTRVFRPKTKKIFTRPFVAAVVAVLAVLIAALALQRAVPFSAPTGGRVPLPNFAAMLPIGARASSSGPVEIPDIPQSSYALGYVTGSGASVAYFRWNRDDQAYRLTVSVPLAGGGGYVTGMPTLSTLRIGIGAPVAVVARGSEGAHVDGIFVLMPAGNGIVPVNMVMQDGTVRAAQFLAVTSAGHSVGVDFEDVNGDGDDDAVVSASDADASGHLVKTFTVYAWTDGQFVFNKDLTWALTADQRVFPEPVAPPTTPTP
jgi:hypothetical protein